MIACNTSRLEADSLNASNARPFKPVFLRCHGSLCLRLMRVFAVMFVATRFGASRVLMSKTTRCFDVPGSYAKMYGRALRLPFNAFTKDFGVEHTSPSEVTVRGKFDLSSLAGMNRRSASATRARVGISRSLTNISAMISARSLLIVRNCTALSSFQMHTKSSTARGPNAITGSARLISGRTLATLLIVRAAPTASAKPILSATTCCALVFAATSAKFSSKMNVR
mmetsp:Transcript_90/g.329  ORF Transcript_90/g.329 Transcript_90/m.329 type:complete len:225 (+) Transcript_90:352-1026(+)